MDQPCLLICYVVKLRIWQSCHWKCNPSADSQSSLILAMLFFRLCWFLCQAYWLGDELADEADAKSEVGKSSRTSALTIPSITGCDCLSCIICRISSMSLDGSWTSACASARGLSTATATSISYQSFLIRAERPVCIRCKIAKAWFSQILLSHSSIALRANDPVCGGAFRILGFQALGERYFRESGSWFAGSCCCCTMKVVGCNSL